MVFGLVFKSTFTGKNQQDPAGPEIGTAHVMKGDLTYAINHIVTDIVSLPEAPIPRIVHQEIWVSDVLMILI